MPALADGCLPVSVETHLKTLPSLAAMASGRSCAIVEITGVMAVPPSGRGIANTVRHHSYRTIAADRSLDGRPCVCGPPDDGEKGGGSQTRRGGVGRCDPYRVDRQGASLVN